MMLKKPLIQTRGFLIIDYADARKMLLVRIQHGPECALKFAENARNGARA